MENPLRHTIEGSFGSGLINILSENTNQFSPFAKALPSTNLLKNKSAIFGLKEVDTSLPEQFYNVESTKTLEELHRILEALDIDHKNYQGWQYKVVTNGYSGREKKYYFNGYSPGISKLSIGLCFGPNKNILGENRDFKDISIAHYIYTNSPQEVDYSVDTLVIKYSLNHQLHPILFSFNRAPSFIEHSPEDLYILECSVDKDLMKIISRDVVAMNRSGVIVVDTSKVYDIRTYTLSQNSIRRKRLGASTIDEDLEPIIYSNIDLESDTFLEFLEQFQTAFFHANTTAGHIEKAYRDTVNLDF